MLSILLDSDTGPACMSQHERAREISHLDRMKEVWHHLVTVLLESPPSGLERLSRFFQKPVLVPLKFSGTPSTLFRTLSTGHSCEGLRLSTVVMFAFDGGKMSRVLEMDGPSHPITKCRRYTFLSFVPDRH